jgi:protein AFG1
MRSLRLTQRRINFAPLGRNRRRGHSELASCRSVWKLGSALAWETRRLTSTTTEPFFESGSSGSPVSPTNKWAQLVNSRDTPTAIYRALASRGHLDVDDGQLAALTLCDELLHRLNSAPPRPREAPPAAQLPSSSARTGISKLPPSSNPKDHQSKSPHIEWWATIRSKYESIANQSKGKSLFSIQWPTGGNDSKGHHRATGPSSNSQQRTTTTFQPPALADQADHVPSTGIYLWGDVGVGKTLLLDLFELSPSTAAKRRTHLYSFVTELHNRLHVVQQEQQRRKELGLPLLDPMEILADDIVRETPVLCFDEFQTFDPANASLLAAFFRTAFRKGITLFATSNRPPEALCRGNKAFDLFIPILRNNCAVVHVRDLKVDYRQVIADRGGPCHDLVFRCPNTKEASAEILRFLGTGFIGEAKAKFDRREWQANGTLTLYKRRIHIPLQLGGVAVFPFAHICGFGQLLGPADFQLLARTFHTIVMTDVPHLARTSKNALKQFIVVVDEFYQHHVKLLMTCAVPWESLLTMNIQIRPTPTWSDGDLAFGSGSSGSGSSSSPGGTGHGPSAERSTYDHDPREYYQEGNDERAPDFEAGVGGGLGLGFGSMGGGQGDSGEFSFTNEELLAISRVQSRLKEMGSLEYLVKDHLMYHVDDFDLNAFCRFRCLLTASPARAATEDGSDSCAKPATAGCAQDAEVVYEIPNLF